MEITGIVKSISGRTMTIPAIVIGEVIGYKGITFGVRSVFYVGALSVGLNLCLKSLASLLAEGRP